MSFMDIQSELNMCDPSLRDEESISFNVHHFIINAEKPGLSVSLGSAAWIVWPYVSILN